MPDSIKNSVVPTTKAQFQLEEFTARMILLTSNFLMLIGAIVLFWQSLSTLIHEVAAQVWLWILAAIVPAIFLWLMHTMTQVAGPRLEIIGSSEEAAQVIASLDFLVWLDTIENAFVLITAFIFSFAMGGLCSKREIDSVTISQLIRRSADAQRLLNVCAIFLVLGVFHMWAQWNWPLTFLSTAKDRIFLRLVSNALALNVGTLFTIMLAAIYFTAVARIRSSARDLAERALHDTTATESEIRSTLTDNGFPYNSFFDLPTVAKVISPLVVAGPVVQIIQWVYTY